MMGFRNLSVQKLLCAASVSVVALGFAQPSLAQQAAPQGQADAADNAVGDIIVTAQFREQRLQDTPIAITAVNAALMEQRSQTNLSDVVKQAPNVQLLPATAAFGPSISASIRGLGQGDFNPALEPGVGLYIDDVYYPRLTGANFDLMDVERVEILRGPQGTLTGRNSEGGAIKFVSRKPTGDGSGFVQATYGSRNRINLRAGADVKLTDTLFLRLSGAYADQDGYVKNINFACANPFGGLPVVQSGSSCVNDTHGDVGYRALRGILRFAPSDAVDLTISADYIKDVRNQGAEVLLYANNPSPAVAAATGVPFDSRFICGRFCNYATYQQSAGPFLGPVATGSPLVATKGDPRSRYEGWGVSGNLTVKLSEDIKGKELAHEARAIRSELLSVLKSLTPSRDEAEARARRIEDAKQLVEAMGAEMSRRCSGAVFGEFVDLVVAPEDDVEAEVRKVLDVVMPMSIKASDKGKKVLVHVLKWWSKLAAERLRASELAIPQAHAESFVREVCTSKLILPVLGQAVFPYFARTQVDAALVATILRVKISDAMLALLTPAKRRTPESPVRLSYAEDSAESVEAVDWSNVDFDDEPSTTAQPGNGVSIVFAGNRYYSVWSQSLPDFYVKSGGTRPSLMEDASRTQRLVEVLKRVEVAGDA